MTFDVDRQEVAEVRANLDRYVGYPDVRIRGSLASEMLHDLGILMAYIDQLTGRLDGS